MIAKLATRWKQWRCIHPLDKRGFFSTDSELRVRVICTACKREWSEMMRIKGP
jgi:hypothetical protein